MHFFTMSCQNQVLQYVAFGNRAFTFQKLIKHHFGTYLIKIGSNTADLALLLQLKLYIYIFVNLLLYCLLINYLVLIGQNSPGQLIFKPTII